MTLHLSTSSDPRDDHHSYQSCSSSPLHLPSGAASANTSDLTLLISNRKQYMSDSPPQSLNDEENHPNARRSIFGSQIQQSLQRLNHQHQHNHSMTTAAVEAAAAAGSHHPSHSSSSHAQENNCLYQIDANTELSELTPPGSPISGWATSAAATTAATNTMTPNTKFLLPQPPRTTPRKKSKHHRPHETIHAQSLLLGLCFCAIWSSCNLMAPNLTQMAVSFGMETDQDRDLYLGSYCALASGVLSFPLAAGIGVAADVTLHRQRLFVATLWGAALAAAGTAFAQTFPQLVLCRWASGAFMAGSVPVAFSFLSDLFPPEERNAASSGLTACMGLGILGGQVYAGTVSSHWRRAFGTSAGFCAVCALLCAWGVQEPVRGGREHVLQELIRAGRQYDRRLTWSGFWHVLKHNASNRILLWQGFFSNLPWGVIFVFLNDYLSQERGFSVPDATFLVLVFGVGCAVGGVLGGYWGQLVQAKNRSYLPLFMAATTALGVLPFLCLLNTSFTNAKGFWGLLWSGSAGLIASLPSVSVRPCVINVNPPETRGASLTAANLLIQLGRGIGPSCVTAMCSLWNLNRKQAFNITLIVFWLVSGVQLLFLAKTLPHDQDAMESELAKYAQTAMAQPQQQHQQRSESTDSDTIISIEERITAFDGSAAKQTLAYVREGFKEIREEVAERNPFLCGGGGNESSSSDEEAEPSPATRRDRPLTESTPLLIV